MTDQTMVTALVVFVALASTAMLVQAISMIGMWIVVRRLIRQVQPLVPKVEALTESSTALLKDNRAAISAFTTQANEIAKKAGELTTKADHLLDISKVQMERLDQVWGRASEKAVVQIDRAELVLDDTMGRVHETVATVHNGIMSPLKSISGLVNGVKAGVEQLVKGQRGSQRVPQDEEMYI